MFPFHDERDWFSENRFGMFIHWGIYALNEWHEQDQWRRRIPQDEYIQLKDQFNPVNFDPDAWLDVVEEAGMEYVCFTTKHHDGFCMWDTAETDYNIMNAPYGKDILAMLAEACERRGIKLCLYYSIVDWHHPNYPNQGRSHELEQPNPGDEPNLDAYMEYLKAQVRELCTNYGTIYGIFWDINVTGLVDESINNMVRELQPKAVINNRGFDDGDYGTPERDMTTDNSRIYSRRTEANQSVGRESWCYRADEDYYSDIHLIRSIDYAMARGGNYLLNVGPKADGTLPEEAVNILKRIGPWYHTVKESFVMPASEKTDNLEVLLTEEGDTMYVHLANQPTMHRVLLRPMTQLPKKATLLNTGQAIEFSDDSIPTSHMNSDGLLINENKSFLRLKNIPVNDHTGTVLVIKLEF
jgi:alpha-L-fucosidase